MKKETIRRCIRPQCRNIYEETFTGESCDCGALLIEEEIEILDDKRPASVRPDLQKKSEPVNKQATEARLYLLADGEEDIEIQVGKSILIGRGTAADQVDFDLSQYVEEDKKKQISREHARIFQKADGYYVMNLSSKNSLHVNKRLIECGEQVQLKSGDLVIVSKIIALEFDEGEKS